MDTKLKSLLIIHGVFNALGAIILIFADSILNHLLKTTSQSDFIWRLLGICSLALAYLSFSTAGLRERKSIKATIMTLLIFNGLAFIVSIWSLANGLPKFVIVNGLAHLLFFCLFARYGIKLLSRTVN